MKTTKSKIYIDYFTYITLFISLITGMFKSISIIFLIIIIHELGHIFFLKIYGYKINRIELYPFGGITKIEKNINTPINEEILISVGGILFQLCLAFLFLILFDAGLVGFTTYQTFKKYNLTIMIFNALPIHPLDGSILLKCLFEKFFSYKKSFYLSAVVSILFLGLFATYNYIFSINNYVIIAFLLFKILTSVKDFKYLRTKFLLERYMYELPYKSVANEKTSNIDVLKKETLHFFQKNNRYVHERDILSKLFDKYPWFWYNQLRRLEAHSSNTALKR